MATIVTCYYLLNKSKHSPSEYKIWINNLISNLKNVNIVIFTCISNHINILKNINIPLKNLLD